MSESTMWSHLRDKIADRLTMRRLTDRLVKGVPDTVYTDPDARGGFVELKYLPAWPSSHRGMDGYSLAKLPHPLKPDQAMWLQQWRAGGGIAGVLLRVGKNDEWLYWGARPNPEWNTWIRSPAALHADSPDLVIENGLSGSRIDRLVTVMTRRFHDIKVS